MLSALSRSRVLSVTLLVFALCAPPAGAATFTVDDTVDRVDASPGDGACATASATCSLRAAVQEANARSGADLIELPAGTYDLTVAGLGEDAAAAGDLDLTSDLTIQGAGATTTHVTSHLAGGPSAERAFHVLAGIVRIVGVDVRSRHHHATTGGGAVHNVAALTLETCTIDGKVSGGGFGGAIWNGGTLLLAETTLRGEVTDPGGPESGSALWNEGSVTMEDGSLTGAGFGGTVFNIGTAIFRRSLLTPFGIGRVIFNNDGASLTVEESVLSGRNNVPAAVEIGGVIANRGTAVLTRTTVKDGNAPVGGGLYNSEPGSMELRDCTVTHNQGSFGGGISNHGPLLIVNSTISGNFAEGSAGIGNDFPVTLRSSTVVNNESFMPGSCCEYPSGISGPATLSNTILAGNTFRFSFAPGEPTYPADCGFEPLTSEGYNLIKDTDCTIQGDPTGNLVGLDPLLGALGDNGGPTKTHLPLDESPVVGAANPDVPGSAAQACPTSDQRGVARPQGARCDIGAVETTTCGDGTVAPEEACDDGNTAGGDCCAADCQAATVCPACESCVGAAGCVATPLSSCRTSTRRFSGGLRIRAAKRTLDWKWTQGEATAVADFGDLAGDGRLAFCLFDESGATPTVAFRAVTKPGTCDGVPCWQPANASGLHYRNAAGAPNGLTQIRLKAGGDGKARIILAGKGVALTPPTLPLGLPLRAQLQSETGACFEGNYFEVGVSRNTSDELKARSFLSTTAP